MDTLLSEEQRSGITVEPVEKPPVGEAKNFRRYDPTQVFWLSPALDHRSRGPRGLLHLRGRGGDARPRAQPRRRRS